MTMNRGQMTMNLGHLTMNRVHLYFPYYLYRMCQMTTICGQMTMIHGHLTMNRGHLYNKNVQQNAEAYDNWLKQVCTDVHKNVSNDHES